MKFVLFGVFLFALCGVSACTKSSTDPMATSHSDSNPAGRRDTATFGAGCFWCVEAVFQRIHGVQSVTSGYAGGTLRHPTYEDVCTGLTGHAEVCRIIYDPDQVTYPELLEVFFSVHDPTTLNRQGADVGTQYRSVIFTHSSEQDSLAVQYRDTLDRSGLFSKSIVTHIAPAPEFFPAEGYHQDYFDRNRGHGYCQFIIAPKLDSFTKKFARLLKKG